MLCKLDSLLSDEQQYAWNGSIERELGSQGILQETRFARSGKDESQLIYRFNITFYFGLFAMTTALIPTVARCK